jgi:aminoglycoside phosphotransferase (APT) family kinase protein
MTFNKDSAAVRPGEELDRVTLDDYLREHLSDLPIAVLEIEQFPGGHSNLTYLIRYGTQEYVLRRPPVGPVAPTAHDMPREFKLLSVVHPHFPLAPKPILLCEDASVIGVPFYLMDRRRGLIVRHNVPPQLNSPDERRKVSESVVDTLAALHNIDVYETGIVQIGKPAGFVTRQVNGWAERWRRSKTHEVPAMDQVITWLESRIPEETNSSAALVHNDFKLDNIMLDENDPARVVAILDWEMCTVGDPLVDLGLLLTYWTMEGSKEIASLRAVTHGPGWMTRYEIIERYQQRTGSSVDHIAFYETFGRFKVAVIIQQIYFRYVKGQTQDERFKNFDKLVQALALDGLSVSQQA